MTIQETKEIIKNRRIELGLTLQQVADAVGVDVATVSRWEAGKIANMRRDRIKDLSKILQLPPHIIAGIDEPLDKEIESAILADDGLCKLIKIYRSLNSDNRSKWIELGRLYLNDQRNIEEKK